MYAYSASIPTVRFRKAMETYVETAISRIEISIRYLPNVSLSRYHCNNVNGGETLNCNPRMHGATWRARVQFGTLSRPTDVKLPQLAAQVFLRLSPACKGSKDGLVGRLTVGTNCRPKATDKAWVQPDCRTAVQSVGLILPVMHH